MTSWILVDEMNALTGTRMVFMFKKTFSHYAIHFMVLGLAFQFSGCSKNKTEPLQSDTLARALWSPVDDDAAPQVKVVNIFGEPIANAQVLIGQAQGTPFKGNFIATNASGIASIPKDWNSPAHVTVDAAGYIRQTLLNQKPGHVVLKLGSSYLPQRAQLSGQVTQLPVQNGDKLIDFGLVMPALSRADIINFDLDQVISPFTDILTVAGQSAPLPSNVSLPTQKESYIFNLTVSKPVYRLMVPTFEPQTFYAARGRFPFKKVVDKLRDGAAFYEILNDMTILGGGLRDVQIVGAQTTLNIPGTELEFKNAVQVQSASAQTDEVLMMLAASDVAGALIPTDVKKISPNQNVSLASLADKPAYIVSVIKKQSEFMQRTSGSDRLSASLLPYRSGEKQVLMPLVANPTIQNGASFLIRLPAAPMTAGVRGIAVSAVISDLYESQNGDSKIVTANKRWEVLGLGWDTQIQLPNWPLSNMTPTKKVEINFIGSTSSKPVELDDSIIQAATHVSHSSTEF